MKKIFFVFIRTYQNFIRSMFPSACRYYPSCSNYALQAVEKFGVAKGILKTAARILRCNPFSKGGYDPV